MDILLLYHKVAYETWMVVEGRAFCPKPTATGYNARSSVNDTPDLRRYVASLEAVLPPSKTACNVTGVLPKLIKRTNFKE